MNKKLLIFTILMFGILAFIPSIATSSNQHIEHSLGDVNAEVVLVEYSSMTCPFCGRHQAQTQPQLLENHINSNKIKYVYKHFVRNDVDIQAANAAECSGEQGQFFEFLDLVFDNQDQISPVNLENWAEQLDLDMDQWRICQQNEEHRSKVLADTQEGQSNGVRGTPGFLLNGELISGAQPYNTFAAAINSALGDDKSQPIEEDESVDEIDFSNNRAEGNSNADVFIVKYNSLTCPFCSRHHRQTVPQIRENYVETDKVWRVFKHFVRNDIDVMAANAAECAGDQGQFFEYVDLVFDNQENINEANLQTWAQELNLNMDMWRRCQRNEDHREKILADTQEGQDLGIRGTPGFFINDEKVSGAQPYSTFANIIDNELDKFNSLNPPKEEETSGWDCEIVPEFACEDANVTMSGQGLTGLEFSLRNQVGIGILDFVVGEIDIEIDRNEFDGDVTRVLNACKAYINNEELSENNLARPGEEFDVLCEFSQISDVSDDSVFDIGFGYDREDRSIQQPGNLRISKSKFEEKELVDVVFDEGWNLASIPFTDETAFEENDCDDLTFFGWGGNQYEIEHGSLGSYEGYWVRSESTCAVSFDAGQSRHINTRTLERGWNIISPNVDKQASSLPDDCDILAGPFEFDAERNEYEQVSALDSTKGYWINVAESCKIGAMSPPRPPQNV